MENTSFIDLLFGHEGWVATVSFIFFTLAGMTFVKVIRYNKRKKQLLASNPPIRLQFEFSKWKDDNSVDFIAAFMASFFFFRFFPDAFTFINKFYELPVAEDKMFYGLILGVLFQYILHKIMNNVTLEKTIDKVLSKPQ
ncbi:hypothetical protein [Gelidibacter japonicus]|uniref:hypothetical protein n=1 Tax=Gelidibacter japonicus TaxID=1962232 RepID=UPI002AFEBD5E|nr:hypothetical protein [Gelidibacter japonicus]